MSESATGSLHEFDSAPMSSTHWRWSILAVLADYFDAGASVAGAVSLTIWAKAYGLSDNTIGLIAALGPHAVAAGIGALLGGWLADRLGRKRIYALDLLLFALGTLLVATSQGPTQIIVGYMITGLAVGIDIPTSWSLLAEFSPARSRGKVFGLTVTAWALGPTVVSALGALLVPLGLWGPRIIFLHLTVVAIVVWWLRRGLPESPRWLALHGRYDKVRETARALGIDPEAVVRSGSEYVRSVRLTRYRELFRRENLRKVAFMVPLYTIWGLPAGTYGFFLPYLLAHTGSRGPAVADLINTISHLGGVVGGILFMLVGDRIGRRAIWGLGTFVIALAFFAFLIVPVSNLAMVLINVIAVALIGNLCVTSTLRLWSVELFSTQVRGTFQGLSYGVMRIVLGVWSLAVVGIVDTMGFTSLAVMLGGMWAVLFVLGLAFGPNAIGRSIDESEDA